MTIQFERGKVVVIDRGARKLRVGQGMLKGMAVVWHHWLKSFQKLDNFSKTAGVFTVEYPDERIKLPEAYRNMPILLYDDETGQELCTACFQCQRVCPPQVIHINQARNPETGKAIPAAAEFIIEYDACMSCGFCAEVCPFDSIKMDHEFELSTEDHAELTMNKAQLSRPVSYYERIAPTFWAEVKASAYKKLQNSVKRRVDLIGIAPQMVEKVKAMRAAAAESEATEAAPSSAPTKPSAAETSPATDKAAKLAAIRAANAAKQDAGNGGTSTPEAPAGDDKAAKLAAIRAANAAKKAAESGEGSASVAPAAPEAPAGDDKAARLAAIRAANAAKKAKDEQENS